MAKAKSVQLDGFDAAARALKATPHACIQASGVAVNALLGAIIVAGSIPLLTAKLDADGGVTDTNYAAGQNPADISQALAKFGAILTKLDADAGVNATNYASTLAATAVSLYDNYVALLKKLDGDSGVTDTNYAATCVKADYVGFLATPLDG